MSDVKSWNQSDRPRRHGSFTWDFLLSSCKRSKINVRVGKRAEKSIYVLSICSKHTSVQLIIHLAWQDITCFSSLTLFKNNFLKQNRENCLSIWHYLPQLLNFLSRHARKVVWFNFFWGFLDTFLCFFLIQSSFYEYVQMYSGKDVNQQINRNFFGSTAGAK